MQTRPRRGVWLVAACLCAVWFAVLAPSALAESNGVARTPPMGWNDWYSEYCSVSAQSVEQTAREMVANGMAAAGYQYVNIDDCWMAPNRDGNGNLVANPSRFPSGIAPVAAYVHSLGLKLGIYEDAGTTTCAGLPGSFGHEAQDAATFASWGVDYLKYDRCNIPYGDYPGVSQEQVDQTLYTRMSQALQATGRPIVFSACDPNPGVDPWTWGSSVANAWRTTPDIEDNYGSMLANFEGTVDLYKSAGPGGWNDPDLLQIGNGGSSPTEYQSEFSLWAEMSAPLIASTNLADLSPTALAIYENEDVIAVDQDPLGRQGVPIQSAGGLWVLTKPLSGGERSVLLFNSTNTAATISTSARAAGLGRAPGYSLFNLWGDTVTETGGQISAFVSAHGVAMFRVVPQTRQDLAPLAPRTVLSLTASSTQIQAGATTTLHETFADEGTVSVKRLALSLSAPPGWHVKRLGRARRGRLAAGRLAAGRRVTVAYLITAPAAGPPLGLGMLTGSAAYDPVDGLSDASANLGVIVSAPVSAPFTTADTTADTTGPASFGASDGSLAISASGLGVLPAFDGQGPVGSYAAVYEPGAAGLSSIAQVTVTSDQAGGSAGGAGLIERDQMTGQDGSGPAVALFLGGNNTINMVWNASGGANVDSWLQVPGVYAPPPVTLRLARNGNTFTGYYSNDRGVTWKGIATVTVAPSVSDSAQDVGAFHASGLDTWETTATFQDLVVNGLELR